MNYYVENKLEGNNYSKNLNFKQEPNLENSSRSMYFKHAGELVLAIVSKETNVSRCDLLSASRGKANICVARQTVMYLMHTSMSCSYYEVADFLSRDRTTVSHGCRLIEDMRDDLKFDEKLSNMENFALMAMNVACSFSAVEQPDVR